MTVGGNRRSCVSHGDRRSKRGGGVATHNPQDTHTHTNRSKVRVCKVHVGRGGGGFEWVSTSARACTLTLGFFVFPSRIHAVRSTPSSWLRQVKRGYLRLVQDKTTYKEKKKNE